MNFRSPELLAAVRTIECQAQLPACMGGYGQASHSNQSRHGKGMSIKAADCFVASICPACHHQIDHGNKMSQEERIDAWQRAHERTLLALFERGLVTVAGASGKRERKPARSSKINPWKGRP